jgi:hypothetical protein
MDDLVTVMVEGNIWRSEGKLFRGINERNDRIWQREIHNIFLSLR